jgi:DnaK suppressor protein
MSPAKKSSKKTASKPAAGRARKTTARKATAKSRKTTVKKTTAKKTAAAKTAAKKAATKKTTARKTAVKKTVARKPAARSSVKKPTRRKAPAAHAQSPNRPPRPVKLDKKALAQIRSTLADQRADLMRQQAELQEDSFDSTQSDLSGEMGFDEDFADAGTATFDRERDLSIRNNIQDLVEQITRAIRRIDDGTYGACERCGRPIDAARLKALPHALLCMDCKRRQERAR